MGDVAGVRSFVRARPVTVTAVLSAVGYALVFSALYGDLGLFPPLSRGTVDLFGHLIAGINLLALSSLLVGWRFIRRNEIRRHRAAMLTAFTLIMGFLVLYLWKTGGGFEKAILATGIVKIVYLVMLAIHIVLSVVAVPVVLYAVLLGLTHTPAELRETHHARVGRLAVAAWSLSLALGVVTYVLLNHVYGWEPRTAMLMLLAVPVHR